ncbi:MAG TPA: DsrH/TusB family sulfur metabolism protein [Dissulfurispiraceae bacterium]|nr:DsrH/TusB family sulfur metabolism protein [Dissulfurispiraceae bacterium]
MIVLIKSSPETPDCKRGITLARDMAADLVFLQNGIYAACGTHLDDFCGAVSILQEDCRLRGIHDGDVKSGVKQLDYDALVDLLAGEDKIVGLF